MHFPFSLAVFFAFFLYINKNSALEIYITQGKK